MVRHEPVQGVAAVSEVGNACIVGVRIVIHALGVGDELVNVVYAGLVVNLVRLDEEREARLALVPVFDRVFVSGG